MVRPFQHTVHSYQEKQEDCRGGANARAPRYDHVASLYCRKCCLLMRNTVGRWHLSPVCVHVHIICLLSNRIPDPTTTTTRTTTTTPAPNGCKWGHSSHNVKCDQSAGEKIMRQSSVTVPSLEECKQSCEDAVGCRSITYFKTGWCAHFSTPCTNIKKSGKAIVERLVVTCKTTPTTSEFT